MLSVKLTSSLLDQLPVKYLLHRHLLASLMDDEILYVDGELITSGSGPLSVLCQKAQTWKTIDDAQDWRAANPSNNATRSNPVLSHISGSGSSAKDTGNKPPVTVVKSDMSIVPVFKYTENTPESLLITGAHFNKGWVEVLQGKNIVQFSALKVNDKRLIDLFAVIELTSIEYVNFYQCELDFEVARALQELVPKQIKQIRLSKCKYGADITNAKVTIE